MEEKSKSISIHYKLHTCMELNFKLNHLLKVFAELSGGKFQFFFIIHSNYLCGLANPLISNAIVQML